MKMTDLPKREPYERQFFELKEIDNDHEANI